MALINVPNFPQLFSRPQRSARQRIVGLLIDVAPDGLYNTFATPKQAVVIDVVDSPFYSYDERVLSVVFKDGLHGYAPFTHAYPMSLSRKPARLFETVPTTEQGHIAFKDIMDLLNPETKKASA